MNSRQQYATLPHPPHTTTNHNNKSQQFMEHFNSIKTTQTQKHKASSVTTASNNSRVIDYSRVIQQYSQKESKIDQVIATFNNPQISDMFGKPIPFTSSNAHLSLPNRITISLAGINHFFSNKTPLLPKPSDLSFLNIQNYSQYLASSASPAIQLQTIVLKNKHHQQIKSQLIAAPQLPYNNSILIDSKVDLLLAQLCSQKKRKQDQFYLDSLTIKLSQFIDYLTEDDQKYIGLSLQQKAKEIVQNLHEYQGQTIDGYLKLPLLQYFFHQVRDLQHSKLTKLKPARQLRQKQETCSQISKHSLKSQKSEGGKYSEPRGKKRELREQEWIGKLK